MCVEGEKNLAVRAQKKNNPAFTIIELMIVMAIIGIVAVVSVPNYVKSRNRTQAKTCINNLRMIDRMTQQWAFENNKLATDTYSLTDTSLLKHFRGSVLPLCTGDGTYAPASNLSGEPTCSLSSLGHTL